VHSSWEAFWLFWELFASYGGKGVVGVGREVGRELGVMSIEEKRLDIVRGLLWG